jgi:hypothetical protein
MQGVEGPSGRPWIAGCVVAAIWWLAAFAIAAGVWMMTRGQGSSAFPGIIIVAGLLLGSVSGFLLYLIVQRFSSSAGAAVVAHFLFAPPAVQIGMLAGSFASQFAVAASFWGVPAYAAHIVVMVAVASLVLTLGSAIGIAGWATLRAVLAPIGGRWLGARFAGMSISWWKATRIAVLLVVLAGSILFADALGVVPWPEAKPPEVSQWIEREKAAFKSALASRRHEILVLPVQAEGQSLDRVARSLMTRYLARRVEERTGTLLPDPTLVARALDARARKIDAAEAQRLAESVGARTIVSSVVRRSVETFDLESRVWTRDGGGPWREGALGALRKVRFHDRLPPSVAFRGEVDVLLDQLKIGAAKPAAEKAEPARSAADPVDELLRLAPYGAGAPSYHVLRLQLLASLHERESLEAETLWERSLVALWNAPPSALDLVLEARAYLHLSRRPYALHRLAEPASLEGRALLAVLNGDLPGVEAAAWTIENYALRLMTEIELADLYAAYGLESRLTGRRKVLLDPSWSDPAVLAFRLSAAEWFSPEVHANVDERLGPIRRAPFEYFDSIAAWLHWLYFIPDPLAQHELRLARSVERRYASAWREQGARWAAHPAADRTAPWDYYDLLFALNRSGLVKSVRSMIEKQDLPQHAVNAIEALGGTFAGHPWLTFLHARALDQAGRKLEPGGPQARRYSRSGALAVAVYGWEGGESPISMRAEYLIFERGYYKYVDEPIKSYRGTVPYAREYADQTNFSPREIERSIAETRRKLEYSDRFAQPLRDLVRWLRRAQRTDEAVVTVERNRHRFVGTVARVELLAEARDVSGRGEIPIEQYRELLELDPYSQSAYWRLAKAHLEGGRPEEAEAVFLAYPGFRDQEGQNPVGLANFAHSAGYEFYWRGESSRAAALLRLSTTFRTGAGSEMRSREILALLDNNMEGAIRETQALIGRYNDSRAGSRHVMYLSLLGRHPQADAHFREYANRFGDEHPWIGAFVAHRMRGVEGGELQTWLEQLGSHDRNRTYLAAALRERHAFMIALIDRPATDEALERIRRAAAVNNRSPFYPDLAQGYIALRKGDFAAAGPKLRETHDVLFNISNTRREQLAELLPYLAYAYLRSGKRDEAEKIVNNYFFNMGADSDYLIARALLDGATGDHKVAATLLRRAYFRLPGTRTRSFYPGYILLEACEFLLRDSGNDAYRELIAELAKRIQVDIPYSWAAAFEARYAAVTDTRQLAIAAASILDPKSERLNEITEAERAALRPAAIRHDSALGAALRSMATRG